jgi:hypothetical protein
MDLRQCGVGEERDDAKAGLRLAAAEEELQLQRGGAGAPLVKAGVHGGFILEAPTSLNRGRQLGEGATAGERCVLFLLQQRGPNTL